MIEYNVECDYNANCCPNHPESHPESFTEDFPDDSQIYMSVSPHKVIHSDAKTRSCKFDDKCEELFYRRKNMVENPVNYAIQGVD